MPFSCHSHSIPVLHLVAAALEQAGRTHRPGRMKHHCTGSVRNWEGDLYKRHGASNRSDKPASTRLGRLRIRSLNQSPKVKKCDIAPCPELQQNKKHHNITRS